MSWSRAGLERCRRCGTSSKPHRSLGLCESCYYSVRYWTDTGYRHDALQRSKAKWRRKKLEARLKELEAIVASKVKKH